VLFDKAKNIIHKEMFKPRRKSLQSLLVGRTTRGGIDIAFSSNIYMHIV